MRVEGAFFAAKVTERPDGRLAGEEFGPFVLSVAEFPFTLSRYVVPYPALLHAAGEGTSYRPRLHAPRACQHVADERADIVDPPYPRHRAIIAVTINDVLLAEAGV